MLQIDLTQPYNPQQVEEPLYRWWEESGCFVPRDDVSGPPFVISIPPPNVTGELHLGHAMYVIQDVMIRWRRMQSYQALWVPGTDHAGIATQLQVEKMLRNEGTSRQEVGREEFLRRTWEWQERYGGKINNQLRRLGASCDWNRERFTMDEGLSRAVHTAFKRLYDDGLIYRGTYMVNWSPNLHTAVSDLEVEYETRQEKLYYVRYPVLSADASDNLPAHEWGSGRWAEGVSEYITVATTRPETILGDTAVAVNPDDERYTHMVGRTVLLPALGRSVPIIADEYVEQEFGTGAVKMTPAHDPNDYEVGKRHNLPMINIMNGDATINAEGGPYAGQDRYAARKALVADLEREGLLVEVKPHTMNVAISQRGGEVIEPLLSEQWFVRVQPLAEQALAAVQEGRTRIIPEHFERVYTHWMENIRDWCISRQLWWGHRIPVWHMPDGSMVVPGPDEPPPAEGRQDPDVLDTWFSSGLWPFSTLGWPDDTPDMRTFYPTSVMETGYDILFFWVARMMMLGCYLTGVEPFHTVYLHGLVRDEHGRKMSKTNGNVVDPLTVMNEHGTDALRYTLSTSGTPGQDLNLNPQRIEAARNFANKLWNMTRFVVSNRADDAPRAVQQTEEVAMTLADRWIMARYTRLVGDVTRLMESYNFGEAGRQIHDFLWGEFADWYVEMAKVQLEGDDASTQRTAAILHTVLEGGLCLLHPYMPYVTEAAWLALTDSLDDAGHPTHTISLQDYPWADGFWLNEQAEKDFALVQSGITGIRNLRNEYRVEAARWIEITIVAGDAAAMLTQQAPLISRLTRADPQRLEIVEHLSEKPTDVAALVIGAIEIFSPLAGLVDLAAERERLSKELQKAETEVEHRTQKLANEHFVQKAPEAVVQRERDNLAQAQAAVERLRERLASLPTE
jgi:valyl-tRNA synthetase